ncbi:MAG: DUF4114 domain-containing protein, partial [Actinobacteria bacterium]|nr:DUF4114 domain-containing protein [Actinomycetota bacterium]
MRKAVLAAGVTLSVLLSVLQPTSPAMADDPSLQAVFDGRFGTGVIAVPTAETGAETFSPGTRRNEILIEVAGYAGSNTFGWYPLTSPGELHTIFLGSDGPGAVQVVPINEQFGIFSATPDGLWRSQRALNADGFDHFKTYDYPGVPGGFIAALEDLGGGGDQDFNDLVVSVRPFDTAPPAVGVNFPPPNGRNGWFVTSPVSGTVVAADTSSGGSAITSITCTGAAVGPITGLGTPVASAPVTVYGDGLHDVTCSGADVAGNTGSDSPSAVRIDTTAPTVERSSATDSCSTPGTAGWCRGRQSAGFQASDATSGVANPCVGASCTLARSTDENGVAVHIPSGPIVDVAGNRAPGVTSEPFSIDSVPPEVVTTTPEDGASYLLNATVASDFGCTDTT